MDQNAAEKDKDTEEFPDVEGIFNKSDKISKKPPEVITKPTPGWDKALDFFKMNQPVVKQYVQLFSEEIMKHKKPQIEYERAEQKGRWRMTGVSLLIVLIVIVSAVILAYYDIFGSTSLAFIFGVVLGYIFGFIAKLHPTVIYAEE